MREIESEFPAVNAAVAEDCRESRFSRWWVVAVCFLTFLSYLPTLGFQFVHDDRSQIVGNPAVRSWHFVPGYFTSQVWAALAPSSPGNEYRPLFLLWLRLNEAVFGYHAAGWHFTSVVAHVVATYGVILLARRILQDWPVALLSGLLFGLHPIHIEGVAWVSGVPEPLVAALMIPAYLCWARSREDERQRGRWLGASLALYFLALLTKETAIVLPLILLASLWLGFPRPLELRARGGLQKFWDTLKALVPFIVVSGVYLIVRVLALKGFSHPIVRISWLTVVLTWPSLLLLYLKLLLWPVCLPFYNLRFVTDPAFGNAILPTIILVLVAAALGIWGFRAKPVALAIPWLVFPLLPVLNIQIFGDGNFAHGRYLYLPSVGFSVLLAAAIGGIQRRLAFFKGIRHLLLGACLALALVFAFAIQLEDRYYASDAAFYSFAFSHADEPVIAMDYANTLSEQGDFARAAGIYRKLIQAHPNMWSAYFNFGYMSYRRGDMALARLNLSRAAAGDPTNVGAAFYLGLTDFKLNRLDAAEGELRRAISLAPNASNYHFALGIVLRVKGDSARAMAEFARELELQPGNRDAAQQIADIQKQAAGR